MPCDSPMIPVFLIHNRYSVSVIFRSAIGGCVFLRLPTVNKGSSNLRHEPLRGSVSVQIPA